MYKKCKKCEIIKDIINFRKYRNVCKDCIKLSAKERYDNKRDEIIQKTKDYYLENKEKCKEIGRRYYHENKDDDYKEKRKEYYNNNKDVIKKNRKLYLNKNREKINEQQRYYISNRVKTDDIFKLSKNIRTLISNTFKSKLYTKKSKTHKILGCSYDEFKIYLESKFEDWMTWENRGLYNGELNYGWDIDHIIPISSAKTEEDIIKLNHYTNFQPLCSYTNRHIKRNNIQSLL